MKEKILKDFDDSKSKFRDYREKMELLIQELLKNDSLPVHQITGRVKERKSVDKKIDRKQNKYENLSQITDIIGIRIITFLESDVDRVADILAKEFKLDPINSIDKRQLRADQFGYRSLHYVVECSDDRTKLVEYKRFTNLKFEIQIRSMLQHAWAEIEHDLGYKGITSIPDAFKRSFNRVAALLESADLEFDRLKMELSKYESEVPALIRNQPENVHIDQASLISFINTDSTLQRAKTIISKNTGCEFILDTNFSGQIRVFTEFFNIVTILDIKEVLKSNEKMFLKFVDLFTKESRWSTLGISVTTYYLQHFLASYEQNRNKIDEYIKFTNIGASSDLFYDPIAKLNNP